MATRLIYKGPDWENPDRNPCSFKIVCRNCQFCGMENRPETCLGLKCEEYTPCTGCKRNLPLDNAGLCELCQPKLEPEIKSAKKLEEILESEQKVLAASEVADPEKEFAEAQEERLFEISFPGTPPKEFSPSEKDYYMKQWEEYKGYYRDPTAYAICHNIILLEIELMWIAQFQHRRRTTTIKELEVKQERLIGNLRTLRQQLPEREAQELSDDEKSIGMIYERYLKETKARKVGKVTRFLTPEAMVLADHLHHKVNVFSLLQRLGYKPVSAADAVDHFLDPKDIPEDPEDFLKFMGLHLKEKFAADEGAMIDALEQGVGLGINENTEAEKFLVESPTPPQNFPESSSGQQVTGPSLSDGLSAGDETSEYQ